MSAEPKSLTLRVNILPQRYMDDAKSSNFHCYETTSNATYRCRFPKVLRNQRLLSRNSPDATRAKFLRKLISNRKECKFR